jgi:hypothetical protein
MPNFTFTSAQNENDILALYRAFVTRVVTDARC